MDTILDFEESLSYMYLSLLPSHSDQSEHDECSLISLSLLGYTKYDNDSWCILNEKNEGSDQ